MSKCIICGHEAVGDGRFCEICGPAWEDAQTAKEVQGTCTACGATFTYVRLRSCSAHHLCPACKIKHTQATRAKWNAKRRKTSGTNEIARQKAGSKYQAMSFDNVRVANTKPSGMSDVRWRIELRRRRNPGYYAGCDIPERIR